MNLAIAFECPVCRDKHVQPLNELRPGRNRDCQRCGTPVALTQSTLSEFERLLQLSLCH